MKKSLIILFALTIGTFVSCGGEEKKVGGEGKFYTTEIPEANELRKGIKEMEDSLRNISQSGLANKSQKVVQQAYLEKLKLMYQAYPNDKDAPKCLSKVYMMYEGMGAPEVSVKYADTLIERYPKYEGRLMALESNAAYYDVYVEPRNKEKQRYYLEKIVKEYPNVKSSIVENAKFRLKHIDLTFDELIILQK